MSSRCFLCSLFSAYDEVEEPAYIYDRQNGTSENILPPDLRNKRTVAAAFSPDGSKILYVYNDLDTYENSVAVRDVSNPVTANVLIEDLGQAVTTPNPQYGQYGVQWAVNDRVMILTARERGAVLFTLR